MEHSHAHLHHHHEQNIHIAHSPAENHIKLALSATLHCLLGCGLGEVAGMAIGIAFHLDTIAQMALAVTLGFLAGFGLGILPLLKAKFTLRQAIKQVLIAEGLSIVVMETAEVLIQVYTPGVMHAALSDSIFWIGMTLSLIAGFIAAFPINYIMIKKGHRHHH